MKLKPSQHGKLGAWERRPDQAPIGNGRTLHGREPELEHMADWLLTDAKPVPGRGTLARRREYPTLNRSQLDYRSRRDNYVGDQVDCLSLQEPYQPTLPWEALLPSEHLGIGVEEDVAGTLLRRG